MYTSIKVLNISRISVLDNDFDVDGMKLIGRKALMNPSSSNVSIEHNDFSRTQNLLERKICTNLVNEICANCLFVWRSNS